MSKKKLFSLVLFIAIFSVAGFCFNNAYGASKLLLTPDVFVSSDNLMQADTLLVVVKNESGKITGTLGQIKMHFLRSEDNKDWVSIVGITTYKKTGLYKLTVNVSGKAPFEKDILVSKRDFPVTELVITPQLSQKGYTAKKIVNTIENTENKQLSKVLDIIDPVAYFSKPFVCPLTKINVVGDFGDIRAAKNYKIQHLGTDLRALMNTDVYAVNDGKVVFTKSMPDYGNTIVIDHGLGIYSLYLHLSNFKVVKGQIVKQGDIIGLSGDTGYVTGPHLHFGIKVRGASLDPLKFVQATQVGW